MLSFILSWGKLWPQKRSVQALTPRPSECGLGWKEDLTAVIELRRGAISLE